MINSAPPQEQTIGPRLPALAVRATLGTLARREAGPAIALAAAILVWTVPFFSLPHFWDSLTFVAGSEYILEHGFQPLLPIGEDYGHPVLLNEILAVAWLLLGHAPWVAHAVIAGFAFLTVYYTYRVGDLLFGRRTGMVAALLLLFYPLFRTQSTVVALDLPTAAFTIMAVYYLLRHQTGRYLLCACAMVLTKATGVLLIPAVLLYLWLKHRRHQSMLPLARTLAVYSLPVFVLLGWFAYHLAMTGWLSNAENLGLLAQLDASSHPGGLVPAVTSLLFSRKGVVATFAGLIWEFFGQTFLLGLLSLLIIAYMGWSWRGSRSGRAAQVVAPALPRARAGWGSSEQVVLLALPILLHLALMSVTISLHRYLLPEYTLFFILAAAAITGLFARVWVVAGVTMAVAAIFAVGWVQPWFGSSLADPSTLGYVDFVTTHQAAAAYIERHYPEKRVLAGWPQYIELAMPIQGYVHQPIVILAPAHHPYHEARITALGGRAFTDPTALRAADFDLVYYAERGFQPDAEMLREVIQRFHLVQIAEFRQPGEYVALYAQPNGEAPPTLIDPIHP